MIAISHLALLIATWLTLAGEQRPEEPRPVPDCGAASVYAVLKLLGQPQPIEQIERRFLELDPEADLQRLSLGDLRRCVESFGLYATSVRVPRAAAAGVPTPAILYVPLPDPGRAALAGLPPGHFVVLKRIDDEEAEILDLYPGAERHVFSMPPGELWEVWDGVALVVSFEPIGEDKPLYNTALNVALWASVAAVLIALLALLLRKN